MKVVDIAEEVFRELAEPSDISIPAIAYWIRSNLGILNNYINMKFVVNPTTLEIEHIGTDDAVRVIAQEEVAVLKKMYFIHDYEKKLRSVLGAASLDAIIQISDLGTSIRKVNKNEVGKTFAQVKKQEVEELHKMIAAYKMSASAPRQVAGDDTEEGLYGDSTGTHRTQY